jgi:ornithine carbamoyltransferase
VTRHLLDVDDLARDELDEVLRLAAAPDPRPVLAGRGAALLFAKPSTRTRNSMEMAVVQLGGHPVTIRDDEVGLDVRETVEDVTRTLQSFHAVIAARVFDHAVLERMVAVSRVPIVNMLSDQAHPLQALADLLTVRQELGDTAGRRLAYVGDGNNVCRSLVLAAGLAGMEVAVATPEGFEPGPRDVVRFRAAGVEAHLTTKAAEAVEGADVVYTDAWFSMGQEAEADERRPVFRPYQVNADLMARAAPGALFLHCLPAHRGDEVTDEVLESPSSKVWRQAENRMHAARGLLSWIVGSPVPSAAGTG